MPSSPEEETATHSSMLAWGIPWTEEPGGLQSMALQESTEHVCSEGMLKKEVRASLGAAWKGSSETE